MFINIALFITQTRVFCIQCKLRETVEICAKNSKEGYSHLSQFPKVSEKVNKRNGRPYIP